MAIKFEFVVSEVDAENIISALQDRISKESDNLLRLMITRSSKQDASEKEEISKELEWYKGSIEYTKGLIKKMKNENVSDLNLEL
jgi:hypothetical protein